MGESYMANKRKSRNRNELIRCQKCGEDYSVTYKSCPFCDEVAARSAGRRGGKRLNTRGGGYGGGGGGGWGPLRIITTVLSIALILAAVYIVITIVKPLVELGNGEPGSAVTATAPAATEDPAPEPPTEPAAEPTPTPAAEPTPTPAAEPTPPATAEPTPSLANAESFTLNASDFTLRRAGETYRIRAAFFPSGTTGSVVWTSSNPGAVHVADNGTVTALAAGNSTITATLENGYAQTCIVRCGWSDGSTYPTPGTGTATAAPAGGAALSINRTDITMRREGETFALRVTGTNDTPVWSSSDSSVASVTSGGTVTAVSSGTVTVTAAVDGQILTCIVRCNF